MTVQPVTKIQILNDLHGTVDAVSGWEFVWVTMANGDTGLPVNFPGNADKTIEVTGTFGAGGSCTLEGSNDGINYYVLTDPTGTPIALVAAGIKAVTEATQWVRPHVTAGDGTTALVAVVFARNTQFKF
jgi:hypothetical protein